MAASASASTSTSTAADSNNNYCYDVFINHRGPDVKKTFASHLYRRLLSHGLTAFLDQEELQTGRNFDSQIKEAIRTASVHVAIFSPKYAESEWCLKELELMLDSGAPIVPVFHKVKPAELRHTRGKGDYARALQNLEPRHNSITIENWRNALSKVAGMSGLELEAFNEDEGVLVDEVVRCVLQKSIRSQLHVAQHPTGLDEKVEDLENTVLSQQQNGRAGITGLGGVGKTTLALALFNKKRPEYSKSHFLSDVREKAKNSLPSLQMELLEGLFQLKDLHIYSRYQGTKMLRKHISSSKVLIILDDVDDVDQVDALVPVDVVGHDSLILITSRDKDVLARSGVHESSIYKLSGLNTKHSRELFCSHAFCQPHPLCGFENLVDEFVRACHGLPLSLKVVGALLSGRKDKSGWEDHLDSLQKTLPRDIQKRLKISYDALQKEEQYMFLDVACFFIGHNKGTVITIWNASGWKGSIGFQSLLDKCLVELDVVALNSHGKKIETRIRMHDHLRDLGRDLGKYSGLPCRDLAKLAKLPSRLWRGTKNIDYLLQQSFHEAAADVRGIRMRSKTPNDMDPSSSDDEESASSSDDDDDDESASFSSFKMEKLQLLDIDIEADHLECIPRVVHLPNLLWLRWRGCTSLPPWIPLKKLRVLELEGYRLKTLWQDLQAPLQLRELRVEYLSYIPKSIGQLKHLERIVLCRGWGSNNIFDFEIPEEFCHLRSLKHLLFRYLATRSLPDTFGNLTNLEYIDFTGCRELKRLPNSFGSLSKLKYLDLSWCSSLTLSSGSFGNISTLEYINLTGCDSIEVLPSQMAHQPSLEKLDLNLPNLKEWPSATGEPSGLEKFVLNSPLLETLPSSFGLGLWNLKHLELRGCRSLKRLPDSVRLLNQLTELTAKDCSLRELHFKTFEGESETPSTESTGKGRSSSLGTSFSQCLLGLQHLELHHTEISEVSFPTSVCPNLQHLDIQYCNDLVEVGTLPKALITLTLKNCSKLRKIEGLCGLAKIQTPNIGGLKKVEELPSIETLVSLEVLEVHDCVKIKSIQGLAQLTKLRELRVSGCPEFEELPSVGHIRSLLLLRASEFMKVKSTLWLVQLTRLRELDVSYFTELEDLAGVGHLKSLEVLRASVCVKLKSIPGLEQLTGLRELNVSYCYELEELESVENLKSLEKLRAWFCVKLKSIHGLVQLTQLRQLEVSGCSELGELPGIEHLRSLEMLRASNCVKLKNIRSLEQLENLRELEVSGCSELGELPGIEHLRSLEMLRASNCVKLKSIRSLEQLEKLRELEVSGCSELGELPGIEHLRSLEMLRASNCVKLKSIRSSEQLEKLRELEVSGCSELGELPGIEHLRSLEMLRACNCVKLKRIQGPTLLERLAELDVSGCSELEELPSVEHLTSLEKLRARNCVKLKRLQGPAQLTRLAELDVSGCCELEELLSIEYLWQLQILRACNCVKLKNILGLVQLTEDLCQRVYACSELEELQVSEYRRGRYLCTCNCVVLKSKTQI